MKTTTAQIATENASKYLQQLCKHFGHKVPVEFTPTSGSVDFSFGRCEFAADPKQLTMNTTAEASNLSKLEKIVSSHLERFAFREEISIDWQPTKNVQ